MKQVVFIIVLLSITSCGFNLQKNVDDSQKKSIRKLEQDSKDNVAEDKLYIHDNSVLFGDHMILSRTVEDYYIQVTRVPNSNVITKVYPNGKIQRYADNTLYLTVHHNDKVLFKNKIFTKETFDNINPEELLKIQLMPENEFSAKVKNDTLKLLFHIYRPRTCFGYDIYITITPDANLLYSTVEVDGSLGWTVL